MTRNKSETGRRAWLRGAAAAGLVAAGMVRLRAALAAGTLPPGVAPYESGMPLLDDSRKRISIKFFIVAMIFILFDVDTAFFYPWAVVLRDGGEPVSGP